MQEKLTKTSNSLVDKKSILRLIGIFLSKLVSVIMKFMIMSLRIIKSLREKERDGIGGQRVSFQTY